MALFLTSDMHFGHIRILEYCNRPWDTVDAMNADIVARWNAIVANDDTVLILGDMCMGRVEESLKWVSQLTGQKFLIPGNHDRCWIGHGEKAERWIDIYTNAGVTITDMNYLEWHGEEFVLSHFPYHGDHDEREERYTEWRPKDKGEWLLCGHVHDDWLHKDKMINVGMDVHGYTPVRIEDLIDLKNSLIES